MPRLIITPGGAGGTERTVDVPVEGLTIGREASNGVALEGEGKASRKHAQVAPVPGGGWEVTDLKSTNGTRVNGQPAERRRLYPGDVIEVGLTKIRFEDESAPKVPADACWLEWSTGDRRGERVPLTAPRTSFGRRDSNTVVLADKMASGHHAEVVRDLNGYTVRDLGSTNGTLVNGTPITETALIHGSRLRIGNSKFVFKDPTMAHVEVALEGLEEDDGGWGMMAELDATRAKGGGLGVVFAVLLIGGLAAGAWVAANRAAATGPVEADVTNLVADGDFEAADLAVWTVDDGVPASIDRATSGGRPGGGAHLVVRHDGKGAGVGVARYATDLDIPSRGAYRASAWMRREGAGRADLAIQWTRFGNAKTGSSPVIQTVPLGSPPSGGWGKVSRVVSRPAWADAARLVVVVGPSTSARVDDMRFEPVGSGAAGGRFPAGGDADAIVDSSGGVALIRTATVLLVGAAPWARMPDGRILAGAAAFRAEGDPAVTDQGVEVRGKLVDATGEVPARVSWTRSANGLLAKVSVDGAAACGLGVDAVGSHLETGIGVVGTFGSKSVAAEAGQPIDGVRRALLGDPRRRAESNRPPTLVAMDLPEGSAGGQLYVAPADDAGLVRVALAVPGAAAEVLLVTSFDGERQRAQQALSAALALLDRSPGEGIARLRDVAKEFAFQEDVRKQAVARAGAREEQASADATALIDAFSRYETFRDEGSLRDAEARAAELERQFPPGPASMGQTELQIRDSAAKVRAARALFDVRRSGAEVRRLSRLAQLLETEQGFEAVAATYYDTILKRYAPIGASAAGTPVDAADAETLRLVEEARGKLDALLAKPEVKAAFPTRGK